MNVAAGFCQPPQSLEVAIAGMGPVQFQSLYADTSDR